MTEKKKVYLNEAESRMPAGRRIGRRQEKLGEEKQKRRRPPDAESLNEEEKSSKARFDHIRRRGGG